MQNLRYKIAILTITNIITMKKKFLLSVLAILLAGLFGGCYTKNDEDLSQAYGHVGLFIHYKTEYGDFLDDAYFYGYSEGLEPVDTYFQFYFTSGLTSGAVTVWAQGEQPVQGTWTIDDFGAGTMSNHEDIHHITSWEVTLDVGDVNNTFFKKPCAGEFDVMFTALEVIARDKNNKPFYIKLKRVEKAVW